MIRVIILVSILLSAGCSWRSTANVNYQSYDAYTERPDGKYREMGRIVENGWAHYLGFCGRASEAALSDAITEARAMGANALANVKWITAGNEFQTPHCDSYFYLYWWGASTELSASAVLLEQDLEGSYRIDSDIPAATLAQEIIDSVEPNAQNTPTH